MSEVYVSHQSGRYPILIKKDCLVELASSPVLKNRNVLIISDQNVAERYLEQARLVLQDAGVASIDEYILVPGEQSKSLAEISKIYDAALASRLDRSSYAIALGGGVVGDVAGFFAATYMRGIPFVQVPTTLLSQVDSSVGGKTGVNHPLGKNMIGAFYQPEAVFIDIDTLETLPPRELKAGLAEVIKYGFIHDAQFLSWIYDNVSGLVSRSEVDVVYAIQRCCEIKAEIVGLDERESGVRAYLNFGHTFGHAIENLMGYGEWLHGEAVALGMLMALSLSARLGSIDKGEVERAKAWMQRVELPTLLPERLSTAMMLEAMQKDKKTHLGKLRLVLLSSVGQAEVRDDIDVNMIADVIDGYRMQYEEG